jgi:hypothetical protein
LPDHRLQRVDEGRQPALSLVRKPVVSHDRR